MLHFVLNLQMMPTYFFFSGNVKDFLFQGWTSHNTTGMPHTIDFNFFNFKTGKVCMTKTLIPGPVRPNWPRLHKSVA